MRDEGEAFRDVAGRVIILPHGPEGDADREPTEFAPGASVPIAGPTVDTARLA